MRCSMDTVINISSAQIRCFDDVDGKRGTETNSMIPQSARHGIFPFRLRATGNKARS